MIIWPAKPPSAIEDYAFDFTNLLAGDTIVGTPALAPDGVTVDDQSADGGVVTAWLSGGTAGTVAKVGCTVQTNGGRTFSDVAVVEIGGDPVSLDDAKAWVRVDTADDDKVIAGLIRSAVRHVEKVTDKKLTAKIVSQKLDGFPGASTRCGLGYGAHPGLTRSASGLAARLHYGPVSEILSVDYDDADGVTQTLSSFRLVEGANAQLLPAYGAHWPATAIGPGTVRLSYVAGYDPTELPPELTQAVLLLVAHWYMNREAVSVGRSAAAVEIPLGVDELLADYATPGIG